MHNRREVLKQPFDIETHKKTFINYLEVVILEDGVIEYAVPSHQEKLISKACQKLNVERDTLSDLCPPEYYGDFYIWLCQVSGCIALWNEFMIGEPNQTQYETILKLSQENLYLGTIKEPVSA